MMKTAVVWITGLVLTLMVAEVTMAQSWLETLGRAVGKEIGKQIAAEMGRQALQELMQKDDNFKALVYALQAGKDVCDDMDKEYGPGACANVKNRLLR